MSQYKAENQRKYDASNSYYNFVKVECTSTYPRLTFIIKFLPILNGISLIHVYSQNKLSRYNDTETSVSHLKNYKEIDIIYGSDIKNSTNIEFRYTEPKKLKEIEKFFLEFYSSTINKLDLFFNPALDLKYFDNFLILTIDEIINQNKKISCDSLFNKINSRFYEMFLGDNQNERQKNSATGYSPNVLNTGNTNYYQDIMTDSNIDNINTEGGHNLPVNTNFMNINRQFILKEIFAYNNFTSMQANMGSMSSMKPGILLTSNNLPLNSVENNSYIQTKNEKDNTLMLSNMNDNQSRINPGDYDVSFDFARQLSEISHMENDDENNNNLTSYCKGFPSVNTLNFNPTESMDIMMTDLEKNQLRTENASSKNKCPTNFLVSPIKPPKFKPENNVTKSLSKLQKSISNIDNRLSVQMAQNPRKKSYTRSNTPNILPNHKGQSSKVENYKSGTRGKSQDNLKDLLKADPANFLQNDLSLNVSVTFKSKIHLNTIKKEISDPLDPDAECIPLKLETDLGVYKDRERGSGSYYHESAQAANNQLTEANLQVIYHNNVILESEPKVDQPNVIGNEHTTFR
jgi:hypothetical protein